MQTVNMNEAKTRLSRLVDLAAKGEIVVIAKAGKPMVKMVPLNAPEMPTVAKRLGFLAGRIRVPHDFDTMGTKEIERTFGIAPRGVRKV
jgi:prevent-host-death family protein